MAVWQKIKSYLSFRKQEAPTEKGMSFNLKAMHTINKISIFTFMIGLIVLLLKWFVF